MGDKEMNRCHLVLALLAAVFVIALFPQPSQGISGTLIENLTTLVDSKIDWFEDDVNTRCIAYSFGKITKSELENYIESLTASITVLYAYAETAKFGIEDETKIKWALDNHTIMANGLPYYGNDGKDYFAVNGRWLLRGYYYAQKYDYLTSKWNINNAYANFTWAIDHADYPGVFYVYNDNTTYSISYGPRFYDEAAQTLDCFLMFYQLGITEALDKALEVWSWINNNLWIADPAHYEYALTWTNWECESGGFLQIALKLRYYASNTGNLTRVTTDMVNRYLASRWDSPQWLYQVVEHHDPANHQRRLPNTLMAWASILGNYYNLTTAERTNATDLLEGYGAYDPAWKELFNSQAALYNATSGLFSWYSDSNDENAATAGAAQLLLFLGIIPDTGALAMPLSEMKYQDMFNLIDADLFALNIEAKTLRLAIQLPGIIKFQYGSSTPTYDFKQRGVYIVTFASDWNSIISVSRVGDLPSNRIYFTESYGKTYTFYGLYDEDTTQYIGSVDVTAYYSESDFSPEKFTVDEEYIFSTNVIPQYFSIDLGSITREYWLSENEYDIDIYLYNQTLTTYTIYFLDLAGVLDEYQFVQAERYISGSLTTVEKRKVDVENKIYMSLINGEKYTIIIADGSSYTFGDLLFTSTTSITLTLRGIEFPKNILLTYKYVRIYSLRTFAEPNGTITITYEDTLDETGSVEIYIKYRNGSTAYHPSAETSSSFSHQWTNALNNTDYQVECIIDHGRYGVSTWKQYMPRTYTTNPWDSLAFLGALPFNLNLLVGSLLILLVGGGFGQANPEVGALLATFTAAGLTYIGWIPIAPGILISAFTFSIMLGIVVKKRGLS